MPFIPHTEQDIQQMLNTVGVESIETLFDEIPANLRISDLPGIPEGLPEMQATQLYRKRAAKDDGVLNFIGAGAYEHFIPSAVWQIAARGEFMTAYTPYQAEASQGSLQVIYEFQTMMTRLLGMEVSNASMYDGATAAAEACLMAARCQRKIKQHRIIVPRSLHPHYRQVLHALLSNQEIDITEVDFDATSGVTSLDALQALAGEQITAVVIPQPNFFGRIEPIHELTNWAHENNALAIAVVNPVAMAMLQPPGEWGEKGVDIAVGEGQPLGVPMASGGPFYGFMCTREALVRQMPGRIVGQTLDLEGNPGFTLTLQAREQHIRRAKATSNICTNQGLMVTASTIYMSLIGARGLQHVAKRCHLNTHQAQISLCELDGVSSAFPTPYFHECVLKLPVDDVDKTLALLSDQGIDAGIALKDYYPELADCILICCTETKTDEDIAQLKAALAKGINV